MTLPTTPGSSISLNQVNVELGLSGTATITMNDAALRTLFGKAGSGTTISMSDGSGKTKFTVVYGGTSPLANSETYTVGYCYPATGSGELRFNTNGTVDVIENGNFGGAYQLCTWGSPAPTTGAGNNFWIKFTRTGTSGTATSLATTGWLQMNTSQSITISSSSFSASAATYTIQIASDSAGSNILTTRTGWSLALFNECQLG